MKKLNRSVLLLFIIVVTIVSCKKKDNESTCPTSTTSSSTDNSIVYPDSIYYGKNVLTFPDSTILDTLKEYSFGAILGKDATLKLKITRLSPRLQGIHPPIWFFVNNPVVWFVENDPSGGGDSIQTFTALVKGKIDLKMNFDAAMQNGKAKIDFYENSTSITKTKYLKW